LGWGIKQLVLLTSATTLTEISWRTTFNTGAEMELAIALEWKNTSK
jgi:hypothetical protein